MEEVMCQSRNVGAGSKWEEGTAIAKPGAAFANKARDPRDAVGVVRGTEVPSGSGERQARRGSSGGAPSLRGRFRCSLEATGAF